LFGGLLCIRSTDQNSVEVSWEKFGGPAGAYKSFQVEFDKKNTEVAEYNQQIKEAAIFFVEEETRNGAGS
jgi:hypothetical protein